MSEEHAEKPAEVEAEEPQVEEKEEHDHDHEHHDHDDPKSNRGEKKFKKAMTKMGLKPVGGINRVTIKKGKSFCLSIDDPDVWKTPGNENSYIIFGKPNMDGLQTGQEEAGKFTEKPVVPEGAEETKPEAASEEAKPEAEAEEDLNDEGLSQDNIKMVMEYTSCTRGTAIRVLRETGDDSVNAIMKLTK